MSTTVPATSPSEVLANARDLAPEITARADEVEASRGLPPDLFAALLEAGCLRVLLPASYGGVGADLASGLRVFESLARADGSVGWLAMIGSGTWLDLVRLPRATLDDLYRDGPDPLIAGVFNMSGTVTPTAGGYRVSGRWAFASGCSHSRWFYGNCVEATDGAEPRFVTVLLPREEVRVEDTWHVLGLRGTGSHHVSVDDVEVPRERTSSVFGGAPSIEAPIVQIPVPSLFATGVASVAVGIARGALDDIGALAPDRTPLLAGTALAGSPTFQRDLRAAAYLRTLPLCVHERQGVAELVHLDDRGPCSWPSAPGTRR
jgi:indole-3-acetate monooxygenase